MTATTRLKKLRSVEQALQILKDHGKDPKQISGALKQNVYEWKIRDKFPPQTYLLFKPEFEELGYEATPELWQLRTEPLHRD